MTLEQLDKANKLSDEIKEMSLLVGILNLTLDLGSEESNIGRQIAGKPPIVLKPRLRLFNGKSPFDWLKRRDSDSEKARIILFNGLDNGYETDAIEIPVSVKVIEMLHAHFSEELKKMEAEFAELGKEERDNNYGAR